MSPARHRASIAPSRRATLLSGGWGVPLTVAALLVGATFIGLGLNRQSDRTDGAGVSSELVQAATDDTVVAMPAGELRATGPSRRPGRHSRVRPRHVQRAAAATQPGTTVPGYERFHTTAGAMAHWGVCDQPIPYWVDPQGGPSTFTHDITAVLDRVASLTGYTFVYRGARPDKTYGGTGFGGITYRWTTAAADPSLRGDVVGMTRFTIDSDGYFTGADIELDKTDLVTNGSRLSSDPAALRTDVYLHETGHAMGLDHVRDRREVMSPTAYGLTAYGPGDIAGLRAVGISAGCRPDTGLM